MAKMGKILEAVGAAVSAGVSNKKIMKALVGEYTDGTPRSLIDALNGEILSPKDRLLIEERISMIQKKRKKKKKKKDSLWLED